MHSDQHVSQATKKTFEFLVSCEKMEKATSALQFIYVWVLP